MNAPTITPTRTKPGVITTPKRSNPYQPGPGINPNPKAIKLNSIKY